MNRAPRSAEKMWSHGLGAARPIRLGNSGQAHLHYRSA